MGRTQNPECEVYAGALNHADLAAVVEHFGSLAWHNPNAVQLFVMDQEESFFRVWMIRNGAPRQYAPSSPAEDDDEFWPTGTSQPQFGRLCPADPICAERLVGGGVVVPDHDCC